MPGAAFDDQLAARVPDDAGHDAERGATISEHGSLLDVELEERPWERRTTLHASAAADAADLLASEHDDGSGADPLDGLDRRDDAECSVEAAAHGNRVEMRARPHGTCRGVRPRDMSEEVSARVHLHLEPGLLEPRRREPVRLVLRRRRVRTIRAGARPPPIAYSSSRRSKTRIAGA